ncbi:MAG: tRNA preQ1(34) S-adenosylmethionine ribosyltransferase-isomerase QueA [Tissierellia bacterium]|nr:tRNA preQ1(34) S-adenosylmethionine ribosyltransferase-isomerase QueA [Tissierellia bacterium]
MKRQDFDFYLPEELIAQSPLKNRADSRLLVLDRVSGEIKHKKFTDIIDYLNPGDCLVLNDTRVIPARLFGNRIGKEEIIEILLIKRLEDDTWETLVRPGKKVKPNTIVEFGKGILNGQVLSIGEGGTRIIKFSYSGIFEEILDKLGEMPLPPYITETLEDKERYQTVYSKNKGSAAAPTAGLHFTKDLLEKIEEKGINIAYITLHVGLGTFRPVKVDNILEHHMHSEYYNISQDTAETINRTKVNGGKIISVGTTTTRTLETVSDENGCILACSGWTDIFIYPGYKFKIVDKLITNFHLPESTLLMLVSAFSTREIVLNAYNEAVKERYRFFSFGDAMLIK